jgi:hypothetical protein
VLRRALGRAALLHARLPFGATAALQALALLSPASTALGVGGAARGIALAGFATGFALPRLLSARGASEVVVRTGGAARPAWDRPLVSPFSKKVKEATA